MHEDLADALLDLLGLMKDHLQRAWGPLGLTPPMAFALKELSHGGPMPQRELALCMGYDPSHITALADRLEERGFVERQIDPNDRRVRQLVLSPAGHAVCDEIHARLAEEHPLAVGLTDAEQARLAALLRKAMAAAAEAKATRPATHVAW